MEIQLTDEQNNAVNLVKAWFAAGKTNEFKLGGYAGTGKTTIIKSLLKALEDVDITVSAFTGKAVNVLGKKGINAQTLHSLIYDFEPLQGGGVFFIKKSKLYDDLIIIDEASMLSTDLYRDLKSFNKKYLFVGDPGQLEPVGENPDLMRSPDFVLKTIHRQAEKSPIISLANDIRKGGSLRQSTGEELTIRDKQIKASDATSVDQVICAKNKTRITLNQRMRVFKQLPLAKIVEGEKIIVLRNNINYAVFNGMILFIENIKKEEHNHWLVDAKDEVGKSYKEIPIWKQPFENPESVEKNPVIPRLNNFAIIYADYAYAITCHKSQGSEWNSVLVWDEWMPPQVWDMKRWRYTAITRAAQKLVYCI